MDPVIQSLELHSADGRPLVHKFYRHEAGAAGLLVTFPGARYGVDGPLLYYPSQILGRRGWDTLALNYGFQSSMVDPMEYGLGEIISECQAGLHAALSERDYPRIGLLGKSLGTGIVAQLCPSIPEPERVRAAYLTPLLGTPFFDPVVAQTSQPGFLAMGSRDRFYEQQALEELLAQKPMEFLLVEGADHSMDVAGDLAASVRAAERVAGRTLEFLLAEG